jgi:hypothetical protein
MNTCIFETLLDLDCRFQQILTEVHFIYRQLCCDTYDINDTNYDEVPDDIDADRHAAFEYLVNNE